MRSRRVSEGVLWAAFLVLVAAAVVSAVPTVAQQDTLPPTLGTTATTRPSYDADPLGLLAHLDRLQRHTRGPGADVWQVWVCNLSNNRPLTASPSTIARQLRLVTQPYYEWLSGGLYTPVFVAGGEPVPIYVDLEGGYVDEDVVEMTCHDRVAAAIEDGPSLVPGAANARPNGVVMVVNSDRIGDSSLQGQSRGMEGDDPCMAPDPGVSCDEFPSNGRYVILAGEYAVEGQNHQPLFAAHEIGHTLGFPHSFSEGAYDNPMDVMSNASSHLGKTMVGTIAVNRYQAGWIDRERIGLHEPDLLAEIDTYAFGTATYALRPPGTSQQGSLLPVGRLPEMLVIRGQEGVFLTLGARAAEGYDSEIAVEPTGPDAAREVAAGQEGVEAYTVNQVPDNPHTCYYYPGYGVCVAVGRPTQPIPRDPYSTSHVYSFAENYRPGPHTTLEGFNTVDDAPFKPDPNEVVTFGVPELDIRVAGRVGDAWLVRAAKITGGTSSSDFTFAAPPFADIDPNDYQYQIELMRTLGVTAGCSTGVNYCVSRITSRAHMAAFLVRALGQQPYTEATFPADGPSFDDVAGPPNAHWAWGYITKLKDLEVTSGCGNGDNFCPDREMTRTEVAVFFVRALGQTALATTTESYLDVPSSHWAHGYIQRLKTLNVDVACSPTVFCHSTQIRRDLMADMLTKGALTLQDTPADRIPARILPSRPRNVRISGDWEITWDPPALTGNGGTIHYDISFGVVGGRRWIATTGSRNSVGLSNLVAANYGQQLYVRVRARNDHGASYWTLKLEFSPPPFAPTNAVAVSDHPGQVTLTWEAPTSTGTGRAAIHGYMIKRRPVDTTNNRAADDTGYETVVADTASLATTYTDTTVTGGQYNYKVYTINQARLTSTTGSNPAEVTVQPTTSTTTPTSTTSTTTASATGVPRNVELSTGNGEWTVSWNAPISGDFTTYAIRAYFPPITGDIRFIAETTQLEYDLAPWVSVFGEVFTVEVSTRDDNYNYSAWSDLINHPPNHP